MPAVAPEATVAALKMDPRPAADPPVRSGADPSFTELVRRLQPSLLRFARGLVRSEATAEEVVQETWTAVVERIGEFRGDSSLKSWIFAILVKRAATRARLEGRSIPFSALEPEDSANGSPFDERGGWRPEEAPGAWPNPEDDAIVREGVRLLEEGLSRLPASQRAVVILRDVEGLSAAEACNVLDVGETNQRVLLHRGRSALRALLAERWREPKGR